MKRKRKTQRGILREDSFDALDPALMAMEMWLDDAREAGDDAHGLIAILGRNGDEVMAALWTRPFARYLVRRAHPSLAAALRHHDPARSLRIVWRSGRKFGSFLVPPGAGVRQSAQPRNLKV